MATTRSVGSVVTAPRPTEATSADATAATGPASLAFLVAFACSAWALAIPLAVLWQFVGIKGSALGAVAAAAVVIGGLVALRASRWLLLPVAVGGLAVVGGGYWLLREVNQGWIREVMASPADPWRGDYFRLAGVAVDLALVLGAVGLLVGLTAQVGRAFRVPLGVLLALPAAGAVALLLPTSSWIDVIPSTLLVAVAAPIGRRLLRAFVGPAEVSTPLAWPLWICYGLGVLSVVWLVVGTLGFLRPVPLVASVLVLLAIAYQDVLTLVRGIPRVGRLLGRPVDLGQEYPSILIGTVLAGLFLMNLVPAVAPDIGSDSITAHLGVAHRYALQGTMAPGQETQVFYWQIPIQTLYAGLISTSSLIGAKVLHFWYGILAAATTAALTAHLSGQRRAGLLAATLFTTTGVSWWLSQSGWVDFPLTFYFLATICGVVQWTRTRSLGWLVAAGVAAGIAIPSKLTNIALVPIVTVAVLLANRRDLRRAFLNLVIVGLAVGIAWLPWPLRSTITTGNPAFPWFNQIFRSPLVEQVAVFAGVELGVGTGPLDMLMLPWTTLIYPDKFGAILGPHFLALAPLMVLIPWRSPAVRGVGAVVAGAIVFTLFWAFGLLQNMRYLMPATPLFATLIGLGWARAAHQPLVTLSTAAVLYVTVVANAFAPGMWWLQGASSPGIPYQVILGTLTREDFLHAFLPGIGALEHANRTYGGNAVIVAPYLTNNRIYSDAPVFYPPDPFVVLPLKSELAAVIDDPDPAALTARLRALGFTHMMIGAAILPHVLPLTLRPAYMQPEFLHRYCALEFADAGTLFCRLLDAPADVSPRATSVVASGFEEGDGSLPKGWVLTSGSQWIREPALAHDGQAAVAVDNRRTVMSARPIPVSEGQTYRLRLYARADAPNVRGMFWFQYQRADGTIVRGSWQRFFAGPEYEAHEYMATAPPGTVSANVILSGLSDGPTIWIDDVAVEQLELPGAALADAAPAR